MKLGSDARSVVTLEPGAYQFPNASRSPLRDWDANWLVIHGVVSTEDDGSYRFSDPCLTTWEASELGRWLRAVARGEVAPTASDCVPPPGDDSEPVGLLTFTEPTIALSVASRDRDQIVLRVHLSPELGPLLLPKGESRPTEDCVFVQTSCVDLIAASRAWDRELASYPVR